MEKICSSAQGSKPMRVFLALFLIFGLWILPLNVAAQKRRASLNPKKEEKTKTAPAETKKHNNNSAGKMPASKKVLKKQSPEEYTQGVLWQGEPGVSKTVDQIMQDEANYQASLTAADRAKLAEKREERNEENEFRLDKSQKNSPAALKYDANGGWVNPLERKPVEKTTSRQSSLLSPQTVPLTFSGPDASVGGGYVPPDTQGDVGPSDVLMTANDRITSYTKAGAVGSLNSSTTTFWTSTGATGPCDNHVRYDRLSQRWFVVAIDCDPAASNKILIAVSSGPTITGAGSFTFFNFVHDAVGATPNTDTGGFADYPTLGVDKNALYVGDNVFPTTGFTGCSAFVINKANLIAGTLTVTVFRNIGTSTTGIYTPQGVDNEDPSATVGYFVGTDAAVFNRLNIHKVIDPGGVPSISGATTVTVSTGAGKNVPSTGGSLDPLDDRPFAAMINVNRVLTSARQDVASLWTAQSFSMARTAPFAPATAAPARMGGRWYEINTDIATPALRQSGTFIDTTGTTAATAIHTWITSTAMSGQGFMAVGSSVGGTPVLPGTVVAGRLREDSPTGADALGVTETTTTAFAGQLAYANQSGSTARRWGDYSQTVIDPNDDQTIWTFQEYSDNLGNWHERAIKLQAPPPAKPVSSTPAACVQASSTGEFHGVVNVTGTSTAGSEFYDGNVVDWTGFRNYANYADNTGTPVAYTHGGGPGFQGPGAINAAGNGHLTANGGAATTGSGTASIAAFAPNAPGNSTIYLSPTTFKVKLDITGATSGSKYPLTVVNPDGQSMTTTDAVCVYIPTAASANLGGRVTSKDGRAISGATVTLRTTSGQTTVVRTNSFGYYTFNGIAAGQSYIVSAGAKGYTFSNSSQLINLTEENTGVNFTAN